MLRSLRFLLFLTAACGAALAAHAQTFAGSDDFSGGDAKWGYYFRSPSGSNGLLAFNGSKLEFTKGEGAGSYFVGWDGDNVANNGTYRTAASYTTNWVVNATVTNTVSAPAGTYASIGIEVASGPGVYTSLMINNFAGSRMVRCETNSRTGAASSVTIPTGTDVRLRLAWDASARNLTASYSVNGGTSYTTLAIVPITRWPTQPTNGFYFEVFGNSTMQPAITAGQMTIDNFAISSQTFFGTDDFSGDDGKWAYSFRPGYLTANNNGLSTFNGSVLEFTKAAGSRGSYFLGWDGDGNADNGISRIPASYTSSWVMEATLTNLHVAEAGAFSGIGIEVAVAANAFSEITLNNAGGNTYIRSESVSPDDPGVNATVASPVNLRARVAWNAETRVLTFSYSVDGGATFTPLRTIPISTWPVAPTGGFNFELVSFSTSTSAVTASQMRIDDFSIRAAPLVTAQPVSQAPAAGTAVTLNASTSATATYQWQKNGTPVVTSSSGTLNLTTVEPANTGIYHAVISDTAGQTSTDAAIVGVSTSQKVIGTGSEVGPNIVHANGNTYDQVLLQGAAAAITADSQQIVRMSFVDLDDDIVQVEYFGPGTVSLVLENPSGPATPVKYNQPTVTYMKGLAGIVVTGADATSNLTVFSVGRGNAVNQALFRDDVTYDGMADISFIAITSTDGKFGGLRTANVSYYATKGMTGLYAPGVEFTGPVFVGDIDAWDSATPTLSIGYGSDVRVTGGDLQQTNGRAVKVSGFNALQFTAGSTSHGGALSAKTNAGVLEQDGVNITTEVVGTGQ